MFILLCFRFALRGRELRFQEPFDDPFIFTGFSFKILVLIIRHFMSKLVPKLVHLPDIIQYPLEQMRLLLELLSKVSGISELSKHIVEDAVIGNDPFFRVLFFKVLEELRVFLLILVIHSSLPRIDDHDVDSQGEDEYERTYGVN